MAIIYPFAPSPPDRYSRLFRPIEQAYELNAMETLGRSMESELTRIPRPEGDAALAGYTYFGQFVDHDLIMDETDLWNAGDQEPNETANPAGARLDLHHLYGDGPGSLRHGHLYEDDGASFRLGKNVLESGEAFDLPLDHCGCPTSADERNSENLILRQICVLFMKLHNLAVQQLPASFVKKERFRQARTRVVEQYQWLICHDFLPRILSRDIYCEVVKAEDYIINWQAGFSIPVEFAQAAFRFGHSMARKDYRLNDTESEGVTELEIIFGNPQKQEALRREQAIKWQSFFETSGIQAMLIDTTLVPALFHLPPTQVCHYSVARVDRKLPPELAVRTLKRGAATRLPSGQQVAAAFDVPPLRKPSEAIGSPESWMPLETLGLVGRVPLWYYILLEAEVEQLGRRLGTVGSRLVAEIIMGSLRADPESFLCKYGNKWRPDPWKWKESEPIPVETIARAALVTHLINL